MTATQGRGARRAQSASSKAVVPKSPCMRGTYTKKAMMEICENIPIQIHLLLFRLLLETNALLVLADH